MGHGGGGGRFPSVNFKLIFESGLPLVTAACLRPLPHIKHTHTPRPCANPPPPPPLHTHRTAVQSFCNRQHGYCTRSPTVINRCSSRSCTLPSASLLMQNCRANFQSNCVSNCMAATAK